MKYVQCYSIKFLKQLDFKHLQIKATYQTESNEEKLEDICIRDRHQATQQCIHHRNYCTYDDRYGVFNMKNDLKGRACKKCTSKVYWIILYKSKIQCDPSDGDLITAYQGHLISMLTKIPQKRPLVMLARLPIFHIFV